VLAFVGRAIALRGLSPAARPATGPAA